MDDACQRERRRQNCDGRRQVKCVVQLAKRTKVRIVLIGQEVSAVMNVVGAILAVNRRGRQVGIAMGVERDDEHHWHIDQQ